MHRGAQQHPAGDADQAAAQRQAGNVPEERRDEVGNGEHEQRHQRVHPAPPHGCARAAEGPGRRGAVPGLGQRRCGDRAGVAQLGENLAGRRVGAFGARHLDVFGEVGEEFLAALGGKRGGLAFHGGEVVASGVGRCLHVGSPAQGCGTVRNVSTASRKPGQTWLNSSSAARPLAVSA